MKTLLPVFPVLASFGPLFMVLFSASDVLWVRLVGYVGAFLTTGAFFVLFRAFLGQAEELAALRKP